MTLLLRITTIPRILTTTDGVHNGAHLPPPELDLFKIEFRLMSRFSFGGKYVILISNKKHKFIDLAGVPNKTFYLYRV